MNDRVKTGVDSLDSNLQGGFPRGGMILLSGNPGTGKTLLSGEFLYHGAETDENGLYVSFSEGRQSFLECMKRVGRDFTSPGVRDRLEILDLLTVKEEGIETLLEMITGRIEALTIERLVIDSFTAMTSAFNRTIDARITLHILGKVVRQTGCTTILITEIPTGTETIGLGIEEFIADGIIILRRHTQGGGVIRQLEVAKMRGTQLRSPIQLFTLHEGFNILPKFNMTQPREPRRFQTIRDNQSHYSTGHRQLDEILGGFRRGDTILVELGADISPMVPALLFGPLRANFITQGRGVMMLPSGGESVERIIGFGERYGITREEHDSLMRIAVTHPEAEGKPYLLPLDPYDLKTSHRLWVEEEKRLMEATGKPILKIKYIDSACNIWPVERVRWVCDTESMLTKNKGNLFLLLIRPGTPELAQHSSNISNTHIKVTNNQGVILFQGIRPRTPIYALQATDTGGYPRLKFTPLQ